MHFNTVLNKPGISMLHILNCLIMSMMHVVLVLKKVNPATSSSRSHHRHAPCMMRMHTIMQPACMLHDHDDDA
jgi:hypothetical protein